MHPSVRLRPETPGSVELESEGRRLRTIGAAHTRPERKARPRDDAASGFTRAASRPCPNCVRAAPNGSCRRTRSGSAAHRTRPEVFGCGSRLGMAMDLSSDISLLGLGNRGQAQAPPSRDGRAEGRPPGDGPSIALEACNDPFLSSFLRDTLVGGWIRHPNSPGAARSPKREDHDDLHACPQSRRPRGRQPARPAWEHRILCRPRTPDNGP